ncbi:ARM repeat-containing protein [Patellaria atrata CBS 101060]|uniref:ARM repeat-containing protein n=1 Tax=Patellaria atrata CBS 101060 TaxID=1346257 RepID=A0A9P4VU87_9PEZI|nr:ARM repeat-containing protein [Patellaria atrata CBS 101060]
MARPSALPALEELNNASSTSAQVAALRRLKNEIIGHDQRKELVIRQGIVRQLACILGASSKASGKKKSRDLDGAVPGSEDDLAWTEEDEMRLQATFIVGSLASGGPAFVAPLLAGGLLPPLLSTLSPIKTPPRLINVTLSVLNVIADTISLEDPRYINSNSSASTVLPDNLFIKSILDYMAEILAQRTSNSTTDQQIGLLTQLIPKICLEEYHRVALAKAGIIELLASRLAAIKVSLSLGTTNSFTSSIASLPPVLPKSYLSDIMESIGSIIQDSDYRTARFFYSPAIVAIFPTSRSGGGLDNYSAYAENRLQPSAQMDSSAMDRLLPHLQSNHNKSESNFSKAFPALGSFVAGGDVSRLSSYSDTTVLPSPRSSSVDQLDNPLLMWLMWIARTSQGIERLTATRLLTLLIRLERTSFEDWLGTSSKARDRSLAFLIVPLVVRIIEDSLSTNPNSLIQPEQRLHAQRTKERAPHVLADLIEVNTSLQKAAHDAHVIPKLCSLLKKSFDPVPNAHKPIWTPDPSSFTSNYVNDPSAKLGLPSVAPDVVHALKCRASALLGLSAMAYKEDSYRKTIIENGAVACITDSLISYPEGRHVDEGSPISNGVKDGNPHTVLVAACFAARAMSRSVSILRTSLIDYGVARPIFTLIKKREMGVKLAATDVLCNLLLNFSPMREVRRINPSNKSVEILNTNEALQDIIEAGALITLCEHAHSANSELRFLSMWALKHLVQSAPNDIKIRCLEELGPGWLINTMTGDPRAQVSTPIGMGTANAAGEQVDLLNAIDDPAMDIDDNSADTDVDDDDIMSDTVGSLHMAQRRPSRQAISAQNSARLKAIKEQEQNLLLRSQRDDVRIQEQALHYVRNLVTDPGSGSNEMIDHILNTLGTARFFDVLASKLKVKASPAAHQTPHGKRPTLTTTSTSAYSDQTKSLLNQTHQHICPPEIIEATLFILVHIAAGTPKHRSLLLSQTSLLTSLIPLYSHSSPRIRVACVWLVCNLTWIDDDDDRPSARDRAQELKQLGVIDAVKSCVDDQELDVRERAKTAVEQVNKLLAGDNRSMSGGIMGGHGLLPPLHGGWER